MKRILLFLILFSTLTITNIKSLTESIATNLTKDDCEAMKIFHDSSFIGADIKPTFICNSLANGKYELVKRRLF